MIYNADAGIIDIASTTAGAAAASLGNLNKAVLQTYKDMRIECLYELERIDKPYDSFQIFTAL